MTDDLITKIRAIAGVHPDAPSGELLGEIRRLVENDEHCIERHATAHLPEAWSDLLQALTLLAGHETNGTSPLHCEHDELWVMADADQFNAEELARLDAWGFFPDGDGGFKSYRFGSA